MKNKTEYISFEELYIAYQDCLKRKKKTINALEFQINESANLFKLWKELNNKKYEINKSITFIVDKPVYREVFAADFRDRIIHHLFINRMKESFESEMIEDSYSCRDKKGTQYGILRCAKHMKECSENYTKETYVFKGDLKGFFMSIDKDRLYNKLSYFINSKYSDNELQKDWMNWLLKAILYNEPQNNCIRKQSKEKWKVLPKGKSLFECDSKHGLPIGNLTSQIFANVFLTDFDKFVTETLGYEHYGRYVDDFYIFSNNEDKLRADIKNIETYLMDNLGVTLHPKKRYFQEYKKGLTFIGAKIKPNHIFIGNRTKGNFWHKIHIFAEYIRSNPIGLTYDEMKYIQGCLCSYLGFMIHYDTFKLRKKYLSSIDFKVIEKELFYVSAYYRKVSSILVKQIHKLEKRKFYPSI